ncbi:MAG: ribosome biogenesis factor YjgA [Lysobacterales bacterium]|jgi:ribosome-associated protein
MAEIKDKFDPSGDEAEPASKSQRKREALQVRDLAATLIGLSAARLERIPLDDRVASAIAEARRIRSNVARKRQLQFVAKLLRSTDTEPVLAALEAFDNQARELNASHHRTEAWRDHLLAEGDEALGQLLSIRHDAEAQAVRQLIRKARQEAQRHKPPAASRALFRLLRTMDEAEPLPPVSPTDASF